jgi:tripartite-type tricarboxylate transporter receptor subunit TctC
MVRTISINIKIEEINMIHKILRTRRAVLAPVVAAVLIGAPALGLAQAVGNTEFPTRPIKLVVPFAAGGSNDIMARYMASQLSRRFKESVVVDNKAGANSIIGSGFVSQSPPDGYTLLIISNAFTTNPAVYSTLPYDPIKGFTPIAMVGTGPNVIAAWPGLGVSSLGQLVTLAKTRTNHPLSYASSGLGGVHNFTGEILKKTAGIQMTHVPYKGAGQGMTDVMSGQVQVLVNTVASALPQIKSGMLKALAVDSPSRIALLPGVPTISETFPQYKGNAVWWGIMGPPDMPAHLVTLLNHQINAVLKDPAVDTWLQAQSAQEEITTPAVFQNRIKDEIRKYTALAKSENIKIN